MSGEMPDDVRGNVAMIRGVMKRRYLILLVLGVSVKGATPTRPSLPPLADESMATIVGVLRAGQSCAEVDELRNAVQPLLFLIGHLEGPDADRVLAKLQWYQLGRANTDVYDRIVIERAKRSNRFARLLAGARNDCGVQLGAESALCFSDSETTRRRGRLLKPTQ
jgi:hypothetical protein